MRTGLSEEQMEALVQQMAPSSPPKVYEIGKDWEPSLNPTQRQIFYDDSPNILAYGEKGSGKTIGCLHKIVKHCYEADEGLALILTNSHRAGKEGAFHDLVTFILPQWVEGIELEHTEAKIDPVTKDTFLWIRSKHGTYSKIMLISVPYEMQVEPRVKGPAPSLVFAEESTNLGGPTYYTFPAAQLGRRRMRCGTPQQWISACNPTGPSSWVYKIFWEDAVDEDGKRDPDFPAYHVKVSENKHNLPPKYLERLQKIWASDPIEYRRLVLGEWIERPPGDAIFKHSFDPEKHVRGDTLKGLGLKPAKGFPIQIGYDLGSASSGIVFCQRVTMKDGGFRWLVFDEVCYDKQRIDYEFVVPRVMEKMQYWCDLVGCDFNFEHISDNSAFNQFRATGGGYDHLVVEDISRKLVDRFPKAGAIRMIPCPKPAHSIVDRVRVTQALLTRSEMYVSATCSSVTDMLTNLCSDKPKQASVTKYDPEQELKPKRSKHIHVFDALSYVLYYYDIQQRSLGTLEKGKVQARVIAAGT